MDIVCDVQSSRKARCTMVVDLGCCITCLRGRPVKMIGVIQTMVFPSSLLSVSPKFRCLINSDN